MVDKIDKKLQCELLHRTRTVVAQKCTLNVGFNLHTLSWNITFENVLNSLKYLSPIIFSIVRDCSISMVFVHDHTCYFCFKIYRK